MAGLDYLNKKVWHPGSMKNIQKVWEEQQKQKAINKKLKERAKKLQQQRHNEELKRIQVEAGLIPKSHLDRMEWLYDWGNKLQQQKTNEEYLTGKKKADPNAKREKHVFQEEVTNKNCEDFSLLHEDPMFEIQRRQKEKRDALMANPIQMKQIIKEVEKEYIPLKSAKSEEKRSKKHKKDKKEKKQKKSKKQKKHKQKHKHRRHSSSRSSSLDKSSSKHSSSSSSSYSSRERSRKHKKHSHRRHDHSSKSRSISQQSRTTDRKSYKQSDLYKQYLKERFGGNLVKGEDGNYKVDYGIHKKKYRTQYQLDQDQRRKKLEAMRGNAVALKQQREQEIERRRKERGSSSESQERNYEEGVSHIRQQMFANVKQNRNLQRPKQNDQDYD